MAEIFHELDSFSSIFKSEREKAKSRIKSARLLYPPKPKVGFFQYFPTSAIKAGTARAPKVKGVKSQKTPKIDPPKQENCILLHFYITILKSQGG